MPIWISSGQEVYALTDAEGQIDNMHPDPIAWLAKHAVRASAITTGFAFAAPLVGLTFIASFLNWEMSPDPRDWAAWMPAIAAVWAALVAAGYFIITAALFHMTARQAEAAATQARSAAAAAERSAMESRITGAALRGTLEQQRLERRRLWEPLRNVVEEIDGRVSRLIEDSVSDESGAFLRSAAPPDGWWNERLAQQWTNAEWLLPHAREDFSRTRVELQELDRLFTDLVRQNSRPTHLKQTLPAIVVVARRAQELLSKLTPSVTAHPESDPSGSESSER
ncbi:MAG: hypothetical protein ABI779_15895 [Acidobacteriota bacterium]